MKQKILLSLVIGFVVGVFWLTAVRFVLIKDDSVHYHANFALYINGQRDKFDNFTFYEEVVSCSADGSNPKERVHMHDNISDVVHVHEPAATWGHFFANLGYALGNDLVKTDDGVYIENDDNKLVFWLNGEKVDTVANRVIKSGDALLIDYGDSNDQEIKNRYDQIVKNADEYNKRDDPSSCKGNKKPGFWEKLLATFS